MSSQDFDAGVIDRSTRPLQPEKSLGELFGELTSDVGTLVRKELELAKVEGKDELKRAGKGAGLLGGAGLAGWMSVLFVSLAAAWLLNLAMNRALAFAVVGVVWGIAALVMLKAGRRELARVEPLPKTVETLKEDVEWAKTQKH